MLQSRPYFMTNPEWYYHDKKEWKYKLTDKAPKEAVESYKEFYAPDIYTESLFYESLPDVLKYKRERLKKEGKTGEEIEKEVEQWLKDIGCANITTQEDN